MCSVQNSNINIMKAMISCVFCICCAIAIIVDSASYYSFQNDDFEDEDDFVWAIKLRTPFTRDATSTVLFRVPMFQGAEDCQ